MLNFRATLDCVAWDDGRFEGPDSFGAFGRLAQQRETEMEFRAMLVATDEQEAERLLNAAVDDPSNRARRALAMKLLEGLQEGGPEEMLARARNHRLKIVVWRGEELTASGHRRIK
jgi:2,3-bisphosphoglycerate-independent phosphoglycerate mutase